MATCCGLCTWAHKGVSEPNQKTDKGPSRITLGSSEVKRRVLDSNSSYCFIVTTSLATVFSAFVQSDGRVKTEMAVIVSGMVVS